MGICNGDKIEIRWKHDEYANWFHCFVYEPGPKCCLEMSGPALSLLVGSSIPNILHTQYLPGWWYTYPSEKYESQLGWLFPIYGKLKMLQTTDQFHIWKIGEHHFMFVLNVKHLKTYIVETSGNLLAVSGQPLKIYLPVNQQRYGDPSL